MKQNQRLEAKGSEKRRWLTPKEAATHVKLSVVALRSSDCPKYIVRVNGSSKRPVIRYLESELDRWIMSWSAIN